MLRNPNYVRWMSERAAQRRPLLVIDARSGGLERHEVDNSRLRGPQATFLYADARAHRQGFPRAGATLGQMKRPPVGGIVDQLGEASVVGKRAVLHHDDLRV